MTTDLERLVAAGFGAREASAKASMLAQARGALGVVPDDPGAFAVFVPGRIEVLGKHTDYAGGRSLLCAVERGVCLVARRRTDRLVRVVDIVRGTRADVSMDGAATGETGLALYVATAARRLGRNFQGACRGADMAFGSDLPIAAGMSSSSAVLTSVLLALAELNGLPDTDTWKRNIVRREDLAEYLGTVENGQDFRSLRGEAGVGTFGGSEDHVAMLCCRAGELSQYAFAPVSHERQVPMPPGHVFAVAVSGVIAEKSGAAREAYNRASLTTRNILGAWNWATGRDDRSLAAAVESNEGAADRIRALLANAAGRSQREAADLRARFEQFVEETFRIIPAVADRLASGRLGEIGDLVDRSQAGAEQGLGNQVAETSFLARSARDLGAPAASAFGAGFGGSVWALVPEGRAEEFCAQWAGRYLVEFPHRVESSQVFTTRAGPSAITIGD